MPSLAMAIFAAALLAAAPCAAAELPAFEADFTVRYGMLRGDMRLALQPAGGGYEYRASLEPAGVAAWFRRGRIAERSTLSVEDGAIFPQEYVRTDTIARPMRSSAYVFGSGRVSGQYKDQPVDAPMRANGQDRISVHVAIMRALITGADIPPYPIFDRGRWKSYRFAVVGRNRVETPAGAFDTIEVSYTDDADDERWSLHFAPALGFLPVALMLYEGDDLRSRALLTDYRLSLAGGAGRPPES